MIADLQGRNFPVVSDGQKDLAPLVHVLGRIVQQIGHNLDEAHEIAQDPDRTGTPADRQPVPAPIDQWPYLLGGTFNNLGQVHQLVAQLTGAPDVTTARSLTGSRREQARRGNL